MASELQRSLDAPWKEVHILLHLCASIPEGPAATVIFKAVERVRLASRDSKRAGWAGGRLLGVGSLHRCIDQLGAWS